MYEAYAEPSCYEKDLAGGDDGTRTRDLMRDRQSIQGYLVDFAARLATLRHPKAPSERLSWTDFGLVRTRQAARLPTNEAVPCLPP